MRVKVGDTWYEAEPGQPVMVELNDTDKQSIIAMVPEDRCYAEFHDDDPVFKYQWEIRAQWMREGR